LLYKIIRDILPLNIEVIEEYMHPFIQFTNTGFPIVFDVYIPSFDLAFEHHGYQHYQDHAIFGPVQSRKERDNERREACKSAGITCIEVPYWWHRDQETILAVLHKYM